MRYTVCIEVPGYNNGGVYCDWRLSPGEKTQMTAVKQKYFKNWNVGHAFCCCYQQFTRSPLKFNNLLVNLVRGRFCRCELRQPSGCKKHFQKCIPVFGFRNSNEIQRPKSWRKARSYLHRWIGSLKFNICRIEASNTVFNCRTKFLKNRLVTVIFDFVSSIIEVLWF